MSRFFHTFSAPLHELPIDIDNTLVLLSRVVWKSMNIAVFDRGAREHLPSCSSLCSHAILAGSPLPERMCFIFLTECFF